MLLQIIAAILRGFFADRQALIAENILLRQQLIILKRSSKKPTLKKRERLLFMLIAKTCQHWKDALLIVKPDTIIKWHRKGFRLYWTWKSSQRIGRKAIPVEIKDLIQKMSNENLTWGAPRIRAELKLLGHTIALSTVAKYMRRKEKPPSQTWRTFLKNHANQIVGIDFFTVITINFKMLHCFVALCHGNRKILHFNVTEHPGQKWVNLQVKQAFPYDTAPKYLVHDRARVFGDRFKAFLETLGITDIKNGFQAPKQNAYVERVIGTFRRECLDHIIILNEKHLRKVLREFIGYYNDSRTHQSLNDNSPNPREIEPPEKGEVHSIPFLGGLHHRYYRQAA
jgi:transposase InsO family protein